MGMTFPKPVRPLHLVSADDHSTCLRCGKMLLGGPRVTANVVEWTRADDHCVPKPSAVHEKIPARL